MTLQLAQTFWVNHHLDILLLPICMYNIPTPSLMNYSLTKSQDGWAENVHICPPMWKCHSYHSYMLPTKYTWQLQNYCQSCPLNTATAIATAAKQHKHAKSLPLMYTDAQTLYRMRKCVKEEWQIIRNPYQIIMVKMSTINDVMTGNLFPILTQSNIYKTSVTQELPLYMEQDRSITIATGVTKFINNFLSILMCTYINRRMNIYIYTYTNTVQK
jgi:hypothetical protein